MKLADAVYYFHHHLTQLISCGDCRLFLAYLQGGNFLKEYNPASLKLRRRPFMTLSVSVVGKYIDDVEDHADKGDSELYQVDPDDPNILSMELDPEVR